MIKCRLIWMCILLQLQYQANGLGELVPDCISVSQLSRATRIYCMEQRDNKTLWNNIIKCHRPISDEFMRSSAEALCPNPRYVDDPTNTEHSIEDVFFNICGFAEGDYRSQGLECLINGRPGTIRSHKEEVDYVKARWGDDITCKIGECIIGLGYDLGE